MYTDDIKDKLNNALKRIEVLEKAAGLTKHNEILVFNSALHPGVLITYDNAYKNGIFVIDGSRSNGVLSEDNPINREVLCEYIRTTIKP